MAKNNDKQELTVLVYSTAHIEPKEFTWHKTMKVGDAAKAAATAFGIDASSPTLMKANNVLDRNKPLVAEGIEDGDKLELVAAGGGV